MASDKENPGSASPPLPPTPPPGSARTKAILYLAAMGQKPADISRQLGVTASRVSVLINSESGKKEIDRLQYELFIRDPQKMFLKILPDAVRTAQEVMGDFGQKGSVRADVAFRFMDRALGKPKETVQHEGGFSIRHLFEQLDQMKKGPTPIPAASRTIEGSPGPETPPAAAQGPVETDPVDDWIESNL